MTKPKISIIVPCYGVEKYLDRCIDTLINQTLQDIEIILVDDGSPDRVPEMCDKYALMDSRIKVIHKENGGLGYARNSGLELAAGEYVAFVDSDDYVDYDMYRQLFIEATECKADAVFCGFKIEHRSGVWSDSHEISSRTIFQGHYLTDFMLDMVASAPTVQEERRYYMSVWHAIYRNAIIQENGLTFLSEREIVSEDIPFQVDFLRLARCVSYIPQNLYYYCSNPSSLTATYKCEKYDRFKRLHYILKDKLCDISGGRLRADKLFIGYCRTQLYHLASSTSENKLSEIKRITSDEIWNYFRMNYPLSNFRRMDYRVIYWFILHKCNVLLLINSRIVNFIRALKA